MTPISIAFIPLTDCAVLVAAKEKGFAEARGIDLNLVRDVSWATVRDRLVYGQVQAAHLLAPLAVGVSLGLSQHRAPIAAPFKLNTNGNAITFSRSLATALGGDPLQRVTDPAATARALASVLPSLDRRPVIAVVHRFSSHALALRYWLAYARIDPDRDIELRVVPPPLMVDALGRGEIDGFTVGEPWNSVAVDAGVGEIVAISARIWESGPEKLLAFREDWAESHADTVDDLLRALDDAARWCDQPDNRDELAGILARDEYVGRPDRFLSRALTGKLLLSSRGEEVHSPNYLLLHRHAANFPWRSQALWIYSQLVRWNYLPASGEAELAASKVFRSDIYRRALALSETPLPTASLKVEGSLGVDYPAASPKGNLTLAPDRFFDGEVFDPERIGEYIAKQQSGLIRPVA
ncbi:ABC transporter substrate-binding protein [Sphingomonas piscis]|uniref:ABC transporter substrate-binding protein n=1 Tax=Sphingomonas piscis TaxID=2714943 RepID=A0A6G7YPF7_9SPHN|nr:CmpA/NrtA family ABC transporter substrate-binding protein [Sphingomonas piscis]QIK78625.1 ABC transporter substrate-binding protein [Sphingomonas piscis]